VNNAVTRALAPYPNVQVAASWPARRAAKLDVLAAIAAK
jgi:hypothetical protein